MVGPFDERPDFKGGEKARESREPVQALGLRKYQEQRKFPTGEGMVGEDGDSGEDTLVKDVPWAWIRLWGRFGDPDFSGSLLLPLIPAACRHNKSNTDRGDGE